MMPKTMARRTLLAAVTLLFCVAASAQYIPGQIVRKSTSSTSDSYLNPNGDNYVSKTPTGYVGDDDVSTSVNELPYKPVYPFYSEPNSDLRRGPNTRFSDFVPSTIDKASYYMYYDNANGRLFLRVRMGAIIPGAKGFTFLFDTDGKFGSSGPYADPNYKAATTGIGGNPGFELELDLYTQNATSSVGVAAFNIDGQDKRQNFTQLYSVNNWVDYSQISMAATTDAGDPDYYIDFWVPIASLGLTSSTPLRIIPTTMMAPLPAIGGPKSDIYGLPDGYYGSYMDEYVNMVVGTPSYTLSSYQSGGTGMSSSLACTAPATLNKVSSQSSGASSQTITGTWTPLNLFTDATGVTKASLTTKVSLYKVGTATAVASTFITAVATNSATTFSFSNVSVSTGDQFYVITQGYTSSSGTANESACYQSNTVTAAVQCNPVNRPATPVLACTSGSKGTSAANKPSLMPSSTVWVMNASLTSNNTDNQSTNAGNINSQLFTPAESGTAPNVTWTYSAGCQGQSNLSSGSYKFWIVDANNCQSDPVFYCANVSNKLASGTALTAPSITTTNITASTTSISGTSLAGATITLYINGIAQTPVTVSGTFDNTTTGTWTVSGLTLAADDKIVATVERNTGTLATSYCGNVSTSATVGCTVDAPVPTTDTNTGWLTVSSGVVSGTSSLIGGTVTMYNSLSASVGTGTVSSSGSWSITPSSTANGPFTFRVASSTCSSALSSSYTYTTTAATASCSNTYITSYATTSPYVTSPVTNGGTGSITVDPFATSITITLPADGSNGRMVTLYETNGSNTTNLTSIASVYVAAGATTATFSSSGSNLGLYTNSSTPNLLIGFANYNNGTSTYTSLETLCSSNVIGTVPCPVSSLSQPSLSVINTCPTCTSGIGTSSVTLPAGNSITVGLSNTVAGMAYVLRDASTKVAYSNIYVGSSNGGTLTIPTKAINATVTLEAVGTVVYTSSDGVTTSCQVTSANSVTATVTATTNVYLSGTVFDDTNGGNMDGTTVSSVTNSSNVSTPLYAYILNSANLPQGTASGGNISGQAISSGAGGTSLGTYAFNLTTLLGTTYGTYKVILSTSSTLPAASAAAASKPGGWANVAEGLSGGGGDGTADGSYSFTYSSNSTSTGGTTQAVDFAIDGIPTVANGTLPSQVNPGGTTSVTVTASYFTGTDPRDVSSSGAVAYVHLTSFPANATSFTVAGSTVAGGRVTTITYYNSSLPSGCSSCALWSTVSSTGVYVATGSTGNPSTSNAVQVDPVDGSVNVTFSYTTVDAAGIESTASGASAATMTVPFTDLTLSGTVYQDFNALTDATINGTATGLITNNGSNVPLYMNVVDVATGNTVASAAVNTSTGAYSFGTADGLAKSSSYNLVLSTTQGTVGQTGPSATLASTTPGWVYTGEGSTSGGDGSVNGSYTTGALSASATVNFGVNAKPTAGTNTLGAGTNPGGTVNYTVANGSFNPTDVGSGSVSSITITAFPTNTTSFRTGTVTYYANGTTLPGTCPTASCLNFPASGGVSIPFTSGNPTSTFSIDPVDGGVVSVINYTATDNGGATSTNTGSLSINFGAATYQVSGTVYNDYNGLSDNLINGTAGNGGQTLYVNLVSSGAVIATSAVAANGTYSMSSISAGSYTLVLATTNSATSASLPSGWANTGEGSGTTSDGSVGGTTVVTVSSADVTGMNFGYNRQASADTKAYVMAPNTNSAITHSTTTSTTNAANSYAASITLSGTASSGSAPGALTGSDPDGNSGSALTLTQQVSNVSLVIDPSTYAGTRNGTSYSNAMMVQYNGVQLQPGGCFGSDVGNAVCNYYNAVTKVWEIPAYDLSKVKLLVRNGTASFSFNYSFKDAAGTTGNAAAYSVSFEQPLPVHLVAFSGEKRNGTAALRWTAANEQSFRGYGVERSTDGRTFAGRGFVTALGATATQSYFYNDDLAGLGVPYVYYRLRLEDLSGAVAYSAVLRLALGADGGQGVKVLGNPVRATALRLQLQSEAAVTARLLLTDAAGRVVAERQQAVPAGTTVLGVDLPAHLANGTYTLVTQLGADRFTNSILLDR